jgi:hypothetical protein
MIKVIVLQFLELLNYKIRREHPNIYIEYFCEHNYFNGLWKFNGKSNYLLYKL